MKILLICNYFQPKIPYAELQIGKALQRQQHQVEIVTGTTYFPFPDYAHTVQKILGSRKVRPGVRKEEGLKVTRQRTIAELFARSFFLGVFHKIKTFRPEIIIVFGLSTPSAIQVALYKKLHPNQQFKFIGVDSHLPSEFSNGQVSLKKVIYAVFRLFFAKLLSSQLDKIVAAQEDTQAVIRDIYGLTKTSTLVSHGSDIQLFTFNVAARKKIRRRLHIKSKDFVIIYTGKCIPSKGIHILAQAFDHLCQKYPDIHLLLVGDGPPEYKTTYMSQLSPHALSHVHDTGFLVNQQLPHYYSAADVAVWPLQESLAMLDAASCALPFIANHTLGAKERIAKDNALLYQKGSVKDLTKKIEHLYKNASVRKKMGQRGRRLIQSVFSWDQVAQKYL